MSHFNRNNLINKEILAFSLRNNLRKRRQQRIERNMMSKVAEEKLKIVGGKSLSGDIFIQGSKNSSLPIIIASVLNPHLIKLNNVPRLRDVETVFEILQTLGGKVEIKDEVLLLDNSNIINYQFDYELGSKMRASVLFLGPLLARFGNAKIPLPGGCSIGSRPVDMHIKAMEVLGAHIKMDHGYIVAKVNGNLRGGEFTCNKVSVGVTENFIIAASLAKGNSRLINAAQEPEIIDLANFLNSMGAKIKGAGTSLIEIEGMPLEALKVIEHRIICDRIEAGSYAIAALATKGNITLQNIDMWVVEGFLSYLEKAGAKIERFSNSFNISLDREITSVDVVTQAYPGFPTDLQSQWMALMCLSNNKSFIDEQIFENRFNHVPELIRMGANIEIKDHSIALITPIQVFTAAEVRATDLRAAFCLIIAGLASDGETCISKLHHLDRGYQFVVEKLTKLGANIKRGVY